MSAFTTSIIAHGGVTVGERPARRIGLRFGTRDRERAKGGIGHAAGSCRSFYITPSSSNNCCGLKRDINEIYSPTVAVRLLHFLSSGFPRPWLAARYGPPCHAKLKPRGSPPASVDWEEDSGLPRPRWPSPMDENLVEFPGPVIFALPVTQRATPSPSPGRCAPPSLSPHRGHH